MHKPRPTLTHAHLQQQAKLAHAPPPNRHSNTVTRCNTLQHAATPCNIIQHTAPHCTTLQHTATHCNTLQRTVLRHHTAPRCTVLQHVATRCNTLQHTATHRNALQRTATHCNTLQRITLCTTQGTCEKGHKEPIPEEPPPILFAAWLSRGFEFLCVCAEF